MPVMEAEPLSSPGGDDAVWQRLSMAGTRVVSASFTIVASSLSPMTTTRHKMGVAGKKSVLVIVGRMFSS